MASYNTLRPGPGGTLYGLGKHGIFMVDEGNNSAVLVAPYQNISGGMAIRGQQIYFTVGPDIMSYTLPVSSGI